MKRLADGLAADLKLGAQLFFGREFIESLPDIFFELFFQDFGELSVLCRDRVKKSLFPYSVEEMPMENCLIFIRKSDRKEKSEQKRRKNHKIL